MQQMVTRCCVLLGEKLGSFFRGLVRQIRFTLYNVYSVHRGMFSTSRGVQYIGGYYEYIGGYYEYIGGYYEYIGGYYEYIGGIS